MHIIMNLCRAFCVSRSDHALEEIFFGALTEGELAEVFRHECGEKGGLISVLGWGLLSGAVIL
jgi:hypothetical protein